MKNYIVFFIFLFISFIGYKYIDGIPYFSSYTYFQNGIQICKGGVIYLRFENAVTVAYDVNGQVKLCN